MSGLYSHSCKFFIQKLRVYKKMKINLVGKILANDIQFTKFSLPQFCAIRSSSIFLSNTFVLVAFFALNIFNCVSSIGLSKSSLQNALGHWYNLFGMPLLQAIVQDLQAIVQVDCKWHILVDQICFYSSYT